MSEQPTNTPAQHGHEQEHSASALFANLVMQQSSMAMMLMGAIPHPDQGKEMRDLEAAKLFIDQLEMLETKTKGNLTNDESHLLKQTLMNLRLAYVEAVNAPPADSAKRTAPAQSTSQEQAGTVEPSPTQTEDSHKKFSKKY